MMVIPFEAEHLEMMTPSPLPNYMKLFDAKALEGGLSFTAIADGIILMCAGVIEIWNGRYLAWARVSPDAKNHWKSLHKATKKFYKTLNASRVEADIATDFAEGRLWAEHIGFKCEVESRKNFFPDGTDAALYALIGK